MPETKKEVQKHKVEHTDSVDKKKHQKYLVGGVVGVVVIGGYLWYRSRTSASNTAAGNSGSTVSGIDPNTGLPYAGTPGPAGATGATGAAGTPGAKGGRGPRGPRGPGSKPPHKKKVKIPHQAGHGTGKHGKSPSVGSVHSASGKHGIMAHPGQVTHNPSLVTRHTGVLAQKSGTTTSLAMRQKVQNERGPAGTPIYGNVAGGPRGPVAPRPIGMPTNTAIGRKEQFNRQQMAVAKRSGKPYG